MAATNRKRLLKIAIEGAEAASTSKEKLEFLKFALMLQTGKNKKQIIEGMPDGMAELLGLKK